MSGSRDAMICNPFAGHTYAPLYVAALAAFADGPVADTPEPLAAEAGRPIPEPDRDDTDAVTHG